jgi:hypothetical protein
MIRHLVFLGRVFLRRAAGGWQSTIGLPPRPVEQLGLSQYGVISRKFPAVNDLSPYRRDVLFCLLSDSSFASDWKISAVRYCMQWLRPRALCHHSGQRLRLKLRKE